MGKGRGSLVYGMMMTMGVWGKRRTGFPLTTCGNDRRAPSPLEGEGEGEGSLGEGCGSPVYGMTMTGAWGKRRTGFPLTPVPDVCYRGTCGNDRKGGGGNACTLTFVIGGQSDEGRA